MSDLEFTRKGNKPSRTIRVMVTTEEYGKLEELAEDKGMTVAGLCNRAIEKLIY